MGDHNGGALSVWSTNTSSNGAYGDDGSRFQIKNADATSDILTIGATAKANDMAAATPSTYVGGFSDAAIASFKAQTFTSLSNLEEQATSFQNNKENLQKPKTDKLYTLRFTRYGDSAPVYAAFKNAVADANGTVKEGDGNSPSERLIGFSTTASSQYPFIYPFCTILVHNSFTTTVAQALGISPNYLSACFSQKMEISFVEYVTKMRMSRAKQLLQRTSLRTSEIAAEVGYRDSRYFSFVFRKTQGCTPRAFRAGEVEGE